MDQQQHPYDELLAAFADGEERGAAAHVDTCDRCAGLVRDLRMLRASLSDLPDIAPSRPLRYLPPVEASAAPGGFGVLVRRLFAPAMVAGAALVLVGSVGMAAAPGGMASNLSAGGAATAEDDRGGDQLGAENAEGSESQTYNVDSASPAGGRTAGGSESSAPGVAGAVASATPEAASPPAAESGGSTTPSTPWLAMTIIGAALLVLTTVLRWTVVPRAPGPPLYPGA